MRKKNAKKVLIISGPTGSGESTITNRLVKKYPVFKRLVTATTRQPRLNEKNKIDYYFFSKEKFLKEIERGNIIEHTYIKSRDVYYGSYKPDLENKLAKGFNIIVNPDIVGARYYKENYNAATIFLKAESIKNLEKRIRNRDPNIGEEEIKSRLEDAEREIKNEESYYDYVVINREGAIQNSLEEIKNILKKERYKLK